MILEGKVVIVSGIGSGLGQELAINAGKEGAKAAQEEIQATTGKNVTLKKVWAIAQKGDDADTADTTPEHGFAADDPLAVYVRVERERAAAMRRELAEAAKLNSGGLDKGGMWWLAEQMAGAGESEPEVARPPPKLPRRQHARRARKMSTDAKPTVFRANDSVWAALRPGDAARLVLDDVVVSEATRGRGVSVAGKVSVTLEGSNELRGPIDSAPAVLRELYL